MFRGRGSEGPSFRLICQKRGQHRGPGPWKHAPRTPVLSASQPAARQGCPGATEPLRVQGGAIQSRCPLPGPSSVDRRPAEGEGPSHCCPSEASRGPGSPAARGLSPALLMLPVWHSPLRSAPQGGSCPRAFAQLPAEIAISLPRPPAPALRTAPLAFPEHVRLSR